MHPKKEASEIMLLTKLSANKWISISSSKLNPFVIAKITGFRHD